MDEGCSLKRSFCVVAILMLGAALVFPLWMLLISMQILLAEFRSRFDGDAAAGQHQL